LQSESQAKSQAKSQAEFQAKSKYVAFSVSGMTNL
jgi:hypothetical protein